MTAPEADELAKLTDEVLELRRLRKNNEAEIADLKKDIAQFKRKFIAFAIMSVCGWVAALGCQLAHKAH